MKKTVIFGAAALALASLASCCDKCDTKAGADFDGDKVYTGVLPAADCDGIRYTLTLDYDDNGNKGDYQLVETYFGTDTLSATGFSDIQSFVSEGDFTVINKDGKKYLSLAKDAKDSSAGSADTPIYFLVDSENTITMTNSDMEVSQTPGMNYTLKLAQ